MSGIREFGHFESTVDRQPISELLIRLLPLDFVAHWGRCGMTADYMAHFFAYNFENASVAQNITSTVLNELVENIVKFSADKRREVSVMLTHYGESVCITTRNSTNSARADTLAALVERLVSEDLEAMFLQQIEQTAAGSRPASGLGLLTLMRDYHAQLGVRIIPSLDSELFETIVQVTLDVEQLEEYDASAPKSVRVKPGRRFEPITAGTTAGTT